MQNTSPPYKGFSGLNRKNSTMPTGGTPVGNAADSLKETEEPAKNKVTESARNDESAKVEDIGSVEDETSVRVEVEDTVSKFSSVATSGVPTNGKAPGSPVPSQDESFLSEADGFGSLYPQLSLSWSFWQNGTLNFTSCKSLASLMTARTLMRWKRWMPCMLQLIQLKNIPSMQLLDACWVIDKAAGELV